MDEIRKLAIKTFKDVDFNIRLKTNLKIVDFLNATLNLNKGTYSTYKNPNNKILYINTQTTHHK